VSASRGADWRHQEGRVCMNVRIHAHGAKLSKSTEEYIQEKVNRLEKFNERVVDAKFELRPQHQRSGGDQWVAQFTISTPGNILRAEVRENDQRLAVDRTVDKMRKQIRRFHAKKIDRSRRNAVKLGSIAADQQDEEFGLENDGEFQPLVKTKTFEFLAMDTEEAIDQMELLQHDFFVFRDADTGATNVVYRRNDGAYGLIKPDLP
jgi:putative sigma-54 modulation protein